MLGRQSVRRLCRSISSDPFTVKSILSAKERCIENIKHLPAVPFPWPVAGRRAAVLIPLCAGRDGRVSLLYTVRSSGLKSHSGHVSFPGGMYDEADGSLTRTALRETREELAVPSDAVDVWCEFGQAFPTRSYDTAVTPIVGFVHDYDRIELKPNPLEVASTFTVSLERMCQKRHFSSQNFEGGVVLPVFTAGEHKIWGVTAMATHAFLSCLFFSTNIYPMAFQYMFKHQSKSSN